MSPELSNLCPVRLDNVDRAMLIRVSQQVPQLKPNLVLIDAGTNNCNQGGTVPDAGANVTNLINNIFQQSPGATVILTTILVNSVSAQDACRVTVNDQVKVPTER
jgi:hypothetical protein